jgi:hypothetical protein
MRRPRIIALLACALYGASLLLPLHELFVEEERCVECLDEAGPTFERDCRSAPCDDPDHHHHHHRRHHDSCPACSQAKVASTGPEQQIPVEVAERVEPLHSAGYSPAALLFASGHQARGPPPAS